MVDKLDSIVLSPRAHKTMLRYYNWVELRGKKLEGETAVLRGLESEPGKNEDEGKSSVPKFQKGCQCPACRAHKRPVAMPVEEESTSAWKSSDDPAEKKSTSAWAS